MCKLPLRDDGRQVWIEKEQPTVAVSSASALSERVSGASAQSRHGRGAIRVPLRCDGGRRAGAAAAHVRQGSARAQFFI
eukprot:6185347-Pleurochrysis_carterae.AAC.2